MKPIKTTVVALLLIFSLLLSGCTSLMRDRNITSQSEETEPPVEDTSYQSIECYESKGAQNFYIGFSNSEKVLLISSPKEWTFKKNESGQFDIRREGRDVGTLFLGAATDLEDWKVLETNQTRAGVCTNKLFLEKQGTGDIPALRYRFEFQYSENDMERHVTLTVNYAELDEFFVTKVLMATEVRPIRSEEEFGALQKAAKNNILILGNSFIGTSNIGAILQEMLENNGKRTQVQAVSIGYATVGTYINHSSYMEDIASGKYNIVFICGFYSNAELQNLKVLREVCEKSQTRLVIFPAHNENSSVISEAVRQNPTLTLIDWRGEINKLISDGAKKSDMCINDRHQHSTELAGYVGAHMIYREMYGECPEYGMRSVMSQSYINERLPDGYSKTGRIELIDSDLIHYWD